MRIDQSDEFYNNEKLDYKRIVLGCLVSVLAVTLLVAAILFVGDDKGKKKNKTKIDNETSVSESAVVGSNEKTAADFDFWNMYDDEEVAKRQPQEGKENTQEQLDGWGHEKSEDDEEATASLSSDYAAKGVVSANTVSGDMFDCSDNGTPEMVEINENIPANTYSAEGFRQENSELQYYSANRKVSTYGIDVSKYQGDIDWKLVKESGVDFAMLRMGVRGYSSGSVVMDENFTKNAEGALENGVDIGIYFYSQAINVNEAVEEANYAVAAASKYVLAYPIVFYTETIENDSARTDVLTSAERTDIAAAFCSTVESYGFRSMVCGSKHQLSTGIDLEKISGKSLWLIDAPNMKEGDRLTMSEFPYKYAMWQYSNVGQVDGIEGNVNLDISFVDYRYN